MKDERAVVLRRRRLLETGLALGAVACAHEPEPPPRPCLSVAIPTPRRPLPAPEEPPRPTEPEDGTHWTWDPDTRRLVPRRPLLFVGDQLAPTPPQASLRDPAIARRQGHLADRFRSPAPGAELAAESIHALTELATSMRHGRWAITLQLSLSPDPNFCGGIPLAERRVNALRQELIGLGVAPERIGVEPRSSPAEGDEPCPPIEHFHQKLLVLVL